ncbi:MAG: methionyl-tRNA formyltransferase [Chloroflexi bacterium]|nr:methionyl-tRNA formyltransferase [Chloroflexota bacterium]
MFLGTPVFAVPSLEVLIRLRDRRAIDLIAVVTQPDRPGHRGRISSSPVKSSALAHGVGVVQPEPLPGNGPRWRTSAMWDAVLHLHPDALVWAAYGGLVPKRILDAVHGRAVNVHPSLLPRWRGAEPVAHAILAGDRTTGVTLMEGTTELDAGAIVVQMLVDVPEDATTGELEVDLAEHGARLLERYLPDYLAGKLRTHPQSGTVTWAPKLEPKGGELDFSLPAEGLARIVRAYSPEPGAHTFFHGRRINVLRATAVAGPNAPIGALVKAGATVKAGTAWLRLDEVQPAGKRAMSGADWARGLRDLEGARLPS